MNRRLNTAALLIATACLGARVDVTTQERPHLDVGKGAPVTIDGEIGPHEWDDAAVVRIDAGGGQTVPVFYKHDGSHLLFAFDLTKLQPIASLVPELLIDGAGKGGGTWQKGQWWLHASANDCEGDGEFNLYRRDGVFLCAPEKPGWRANNFPVKHGAVEIEIDFAKVGVSPGARFGFAIDVTDTQKIWKFWPATAKLEVPDSWGTAVIR